jgi:tryptophanyl-tRNA synthetase
MKKILLTGDRPTGPLHLGHYVGSLKSRVALQESHTSYIMIADAQALTDNFENPQKVADNILEVALDYLAVGLDPRKCSIFVQSQIAELSELTQYYFNILSIQRIGHNPTVKAESKQKGYGESVPAGFYLYPVYQAADITAFGADIVPVGQDQLPMIELTREIVRKFNTLYKCEALVEPEAMIAKVSRLCGIDGQAKMSKSLGNGIYLKDDSDTLVKKIKKMYTDPGHLNVQDPGKVEGNTVFTYLDAFGKDKQKISELKEHYQRGGLGDMVVKKYLIDVLEEFLDPIRKKRALFAQDKEQVFGYLKEGTQVARQAAAKTLAKVKEAMHINFSY